MGAGCDGEAPSRRSEVVQVVGLQETEQKRDMPVVRPLADPFLEDVDGGQHAEHLCVHRLMRQGRAGESVGSGELRIDLDRIIEQTIQAPIDGVVFRLRPIALPGRQHLNGFEEGEVRDQRAEPERERARHVSGDGRHVVERVDSARREPLRRPPQDCRAGGACDEYGEDEGWANGAVEHGGIVASCVHGQRKEKGGDGAMAVPARWCRTSLYRFTSFWSLAGSPDGLFASAVQLAVTVKTREPLEMVHTSTVESAPTVPH